MELTIRRDVKFDENISAYEPDLAFVSSSTYETNMAYVPSYPYSLNSTNSLVNSSD